MTVPADRAYPATATNAAWQKKKSLLDKAKSATKTGLGETLKAAELKWKAIPWDALDASNKTAATPEAAERLLSAAKLALVKVNAAKLELKAAKAQAKTTKINKALSKTAMAAAAQIEIDLNTAINRLGTVKLTDFESIVENVQAESLTKMSNVRVQFGKDTVMTGTAATWDRKVLKVTGVVWKVGSAATIKGKTVIVRGDTVGNQNAEGISRVFQNDMKIDTAAGNTATFKT